LKGEVELLEHNFNKKVIALKKRLSSTRLLSMGNEYLRNGYKVPGFKERQRVKYVPFNSQMIYKIDSLEGMIIYLENTSLNIIDVIDSSVRKKKSFQQIPFPSTQTQFSQAIYCSLRLGLRT